MASQAGSTVDDLISPHLVSGAFVQQYYHILHKQPEQVHKFYQDLSILGRPDPNGTMVSVTTLAAINETIMSMDFRNCLIAIETADAQLSHKDGVLIVVTGSLTSSEGVCRGFTQSFFLAPQESGGYFVLNDVFRFVLERQPAEINQIVTRENESSQIDISASETFSTLSEPIVAENSLNSVHVKVENNVTERQVINSVNGAAVEYNVPTKPPVKVAKEDSKRAPVTVPSPLVPTHRDVTKKSYASIVKDTKESPLAVPVAKTTTSVSKSVQPPKPVSNDVEGPVKSSAKPAQGSETTASDGVVPGNSSLPYENGHSVFVRNLPIYANIESVEEDFKKFGAIKLGGVQVIHHKLDGFCFGFVEYEYEKSMQAAIQASPICIGEKKVFIEKKKAPTRVTRGGVYPCSNGGEGGHLQAGRGVYRGDNFGGQRGGYMNNANYRGGENFNYRNEGRENYNHRNDGGENYNHRMDGSGNYNRRNDRGENYNRRGENYNQRNYGGENYNRRNDGSEYYNRRGEGGENKNRRGNVGENYNRRNDGGENYNRRGDSGENNNRKGNMGDNYNHRYGGGEFYKRGRNGSDNYIRQNDGGENSNRRNDDGENFNRRADGKNFNRRNLRNQNEFSGIRGQGPPPRNVYHQNGNGFHQPRPVQIGNVRPARDNGPKQAPIAA